MTKSELSIQGTLNEEMNVKKPLVSLESISAAIRTHAFPKADLVLGIATGGTYPALLIAHHLGLPFRSVQLNFRDENNIPHRPSPTFLSPLPLQDMPSGSIIFLVDDVSVTGSTLAAVKGELDRFEVITIVLKGKADHVLLPHLTTCVTWPWYEHKSAAYHDV